MVMVPRITILLLHCAILIQVGSPCSPKRDPQKSCYEAGGVWDSRWDPRLDVSAENKLLAISPNEPNVEDCASYCNLKTDCVGWNYLYLSTWCILYRQAEVPSYRNVDKNWCRSLKSL